MAEIAEIRDAAQTMCMAMPLSSGERVFLYALIVYAAEEGLAGRNPVIAGTDEALYDYWLTVDARIRRGEGVPEDLGFFKMVWKKQAKSLTTSDSMASYRSHWLSVKPARLKSGGTLRVHIEKLKKGMTVFEVTAPGLPKPDVQRPLVLPVSEERKHAERLKEQFDSRASHLIHFVRNDMKATDTQTHEEADYVAKVAPRTKQRVAVPVAKAMVIVAITAVVAFATFSAFAETRRVRSIVDRVSNFAIFVLAYCDPSGHSSVQISGTVLPIQEDVAVVRIDLATNETAIVKRFRPGELKSAFKIVLYPEIGPGISVMPNLSVNDHVVGRGKRYRYVVGVYTRNTNWLLLPTGAIGPDTENLSSITTKKCDGTDVDRAWTIPRALIPPEWRADPDGWLRQIFPATGQQ